MKFELKKQLKKDGSSIGFFVFILYILMSTISLTLLFMPYISNITFNNDIIILLASSISSIVSVLISIFIFCTTTKSTLNNLIPFGKIKLKTVIPYLCIGIFVCYVGNFVTQLFNINLSLFNIESNVNLEYETKNLYEYIIYFISVGVIPPLIEELSFRGIVLGKLRKYGDSFAIIVSALLFGLMHGNIIQMPMAFISGLALGYLVIKTNSISPSIIVHFFNNFISIIMDILSSNIKSESIITLIISSITLLILIFGIYFLYVLSKKEYNFSLNNSINEISNKEKFKICLSSTGMVLAIIMLLIETVATTI